MPGGWGQGGLWWQIWFGCGAFLCRVTSCDGRGQGQEQPALPGSAGLCEVFWGVGDELGQVLPQLPFLDGLRVCGPSANPQRNTIVWMLWLEVSADRSGTHLPPQQ